MKRLIGRVRDLLGLCPECLHRLGFNVDCDNCDEARRG